MKKRFITFITLSMISAMVCMGCGSTTEVSPDPTQTDTTVTETETDVTNEDTDVSEDEEVTEDTTVSDNTNTSDRDILVDATGQGRTTPSDGGWQNNPYYAARVAHDDEFRANPLYEIKYAQDNFVTPTEYFIIWDNMTQEQKDDFTNSDYTRIQKYADDHGIPYEFPEDEE